jgi:hypothetical protein
MGCLASCDYGSDPAGAQCLAVCFRVVAAVGEQQPRPASWPSDSAAGRRDRLNERGRVALRHVRWRLWNTPACCHSLRRRQQVIPEPYSSSRGSCCQAMPVSSTNRMPASVRRSSIRFRPGRRRGASEPATAARSAAKVRRQAVRLPSNTSWSEECRGLELSASSATRARVF